MMSLVPRRALLQVSVTTFCVGLSGCLGVLESYPSTGLLIVNADEESRVVHVRVENAKRESIFEEEYTVPANSRLERQNLVTTGPIWIIASVGDEPTPSVDEYFDFSGCRQARPVITVESNQIERIGKQDTCRPDDKPYR